MRLVTHSEHYELGIPYAWGCEKCGIITEKPDYANDTTIRESEHGTIYKQSEWRPLCPSCGSEL